MTVETANIWEALKNVADPEIPVLSIFEMGILRGVNVVDGTVVVTITPTYSGCPAIDHITADIQSVLSERGYNKVHVELVLSPAWTTDWMGEEAKEKLLNYGISPPCKTAAFEALDQEQVLRFTTICPQCKSQNTKLISEFGSTSCKSLWKCNDCLEPFDYFKHI